MHMYRLYIISCEYVFKQQLVNMSAYCHFTQRNKQEQYNRVYAASTSLTCVQQYILYIEDVPSSLAVEKTTSGAPPSARYVTYIKP